MPLVLAGATSGSTTLTPSDAVTTTLVLPPTTGAANQKLFINAAATAAEWISGGFYVGTATRDCTLASGNVAYTGVGFKASALVVFMAGGLGTNDWSNGFGTAVSSQCVIGLGGGGNTAPGAFLMWDYNSAGVNQRATIASFDADGFTLTWTKQGSPTGTLTFNYLALR